MNFQSITSEDPRAEVMRKLQMYFRDDPEYFEKIVTFLDSEYQNRALFLDLLAALSGNKRSFGNYALQYAKNLIESPSDFSRISSDGD